MTKQDCNAAPRGVSTRALAGIAQGRVATTLSRSHVGAAARFAREIRKLQHGQADEGGEPIQEQIKQLALATIVLSVAAFESYVNELFFMEKLFQPDASN